MPTSTRIKSTRSIALINKLIASSVFILIGSGLFGQPNKRTNHWLFSYNVYLDFSSGYPVERTGCAVDSIAWGSTSSISDTNGNLLFYADGWEVYNKNHQQMAETATPYDGNGTQSALSLPKPGSDSLFYVFTANMGDYVYNQPLNVYHTIDMSLNNGLGGLIDTDTLPGAWDAAEQLSASYFDDKSGYWILMRKYQEDKFAAYRVTNQGVDPNPVLSEAPHRYHTNSNDQGFLKVAYNKKYLVFLYTVWDATSSEIDICRFNNQTGEIEFLYSFALNEIFLGTTYYRTYNGDFSPDSRYLYVGGYLPFYNLAHIFQFDMKFVEDEAAFIASMIKIGEAPAINLQLAPDGKIYCFSSKLLGPADDIVSVINKPGKPGLACDFQPNAFATSIGDIQVPFVNFPPDFLFRFDFEGQCEGDVFSFDPWFFPEPVSYLWNFGDLASGTNNTSTLSHPAHVFSDGGTYKVAITVVYPDGRVEDTYREVDVDYLPEPDLGPDTLVCEGTPVTMNAGNEPGSYAWSNGTLGQTSITVVDTGIYWVDVTNAEGCRTRDSIHVGWYNQAVLNETNLVITPTSCGSSDGSITGLTIDGVVPVTWGWYDGMGNLLGNNLDISGLPVGNYFLHVTDDHGCVSISDSYTITDAGNILIDSVNFLPAHCQQNNGLIQVFANTASGVDYSYSIDDGNLWQDQPLFENLVSGSYLVRVKDNGACETVFDNNPVVIPEMEGPQASAVSTPETDNLSDGSINITAVVSSSDITYSIDNGTTIQVNDGMFTGLPAGLYTCLVQDDYGCDTTFIVEVEHRVSQIIEAIAGNGYTCIGNATTCPLLINNFMAVDSFHVTLVYDPALVECTGYFQIHPELEPGFQASLFPDLGEINLSWKGEQPVSLSDTTMVTLVFTAWGEGHPELNWLNDQGQSRFFDVSGHEINAHLQPGIIKVSSRPKILPPGTQLICAGESLMILPFVYDGTGEIRYEWITPNGDTDSTEMLWINNITPQQAGEYLITVTDTIDCQDTDTVLVIVSTGPPIAFSGYDTLFVEPGYILDAGNNAQNYWWNTGDTTAQIAINSIGQYLVLATSFENCKSTDSVYILWAGKSFFIPNAFTPNGDGLNDVFGVIPRLDYVNQFRFSIFNRWGQLIFDTSDLNQGWDGTIKGEACQAGVYVYRIVYQDFGMGTQESKVMEGTVMLVR